MNIKVCEALRTANHASSLISKGIGDLIDVRDDDQEIYTHNLEAAKEFLIRALSEIKNDNFEVSEEVCNLASSFHTLLRKCCESLSSTLLYCAIKDHPDQWNAILGNVTELIESEKFNFEKEDLDVLKLLELADTFDDMFELEAALKFFSLEEPDVAKMKWVIIRA